MDDELDMVTCEACGERLRYEDADGEYYHPDCLRELEPTCGYCDRPITPGQLTTYNLSGDLRHETCPADDEGSEEREETAA